MCPSILKMLITEPRNLITSTSLLLRGSKARPELGDAHVATFFGWESGFADPTA